MAMKPWMPLVAVLALTLGLAGCDSGEEETAPDEGDKAPQESAQPATDEAASTADTSTADDEPVATQEDGVADEAASTAAPSANDEPVASQEDGIAEEAGIDSEAEVDAGAETLDESPEDTLEEGSALPGETTRADVDAIIEETEKRFEEASRQIDEQFEQAEKQRPDAEPMAAPSSSDELDAVLEERPPLPDDTSTVPDGIGDSDVDAIIKENEKRFEEASRKIDEQFEEAERQEPGASSEGDASVVDDKDGTTD